MRISVSRLEQTSPTKRRKLEAQKKSLDLRDDDDYLGPRSWSSARRERRNYDSSEGDQSSPSTRGKKGKDREITPTDSSDGTKSESEMKSSSDDENSNSEIEKLLNDPEPKPEIEKPLADKALSIAMEITEAEMPENVSSTNDDDADESNEENIDQRSAELISEIWLLRIRCLASKIPWTVKLANICTMVFGIQPLSL